MKKINSCSPTSLVPAVTHLRLVSSHCWVPIKAQLLKITGTAVGWPGKQMLAISWITSGRGDKKMETLLLCARAGCVMCAFLPLTSHARQWTGLNYSWLELIKQLWDKWIWSFNLMQQSNLPMVLNGRKFHLTWLGQTEEWFELLILSEIFFFLVHLKEWKRTNIFLYIGKKQLTICTSS